MRHLVLGSEGQIGKYVCDEIERNGDEVIRWDIKLGKEYDLRHGSDKVYHAFLSADFVHFLAFDVGGSTYLAKNQNNFHYIHNNAEIMRIVFNSLNATQKPFYFASSQMSNMPDSVYGQLKAVGESYTRALGGGVVLFWNVYGYESDPEKTHVITDFIKQALNEGKITCKTDGQEERHFTHAQDTAYILYLITQQYDDLDKSEYWDVVRPWSTTDSAWCSIETIANIIGEKLQVPVYFTKKLDQNQTQKNNPGWYLSGRLIEPHSANHKWINIHHGINSMIKRIREDG